MTSYPYFILTDSSGSGGCRFRIVEGGYKPVLERDQDWKKTLGGTWDVSQGNNFEVHEYLVKVRQTDPDVNMGTLADLQRLWTLNSPNGTITDKLTMVDNFGVTHLVMFKGPFPKQAITTIIEGNEAWYFIPISFGFLS